jgi:hypothetical protein
MERDLTGTANLAAVTMTGDRSVWAIFVGDNRPPILGAVGNQEVAEGELFEWGLQATDPDLPAQPLTYALVSGPPGATVDAVTGRFSWIVTEPFGASTQQVRVRISDDGTPPLSDVVEFDVRVEGLPPVVSLESPVAGVTGDERAVLTGTVTDNVGVGVVAQDRAGNATVADLVATWEPLRTLATLDAVEVPDGQRTTVPVQFVSRGDVGGLTFLLTYDPEFLRDPELVWDAAVGEAATTVDRTTLGEIRATLSQGGGTIPAGSQRLAEVTFRTRSVPFAQITPVTPQVVDASDPTAIKFPVGTDAASGGARIRPR